MTTESDWDGFRRRAQHHYQHHLVRNLANPTVAVVVGAHSNMVAPSLLDNVKTEIDAASELGSPATVIVDGSPTASTPVSLKTANDNPLYQQDQVKRPPAPARTGLVALWTKIVESAGGKAEVKQAPLPGTRPRDGLPPVTIVPVAARSIGPLASVTALRDGTIGFVPDQAVLKDPPRPRGPR